MIKEELNIIKVGGAVVEDEESLEGLLMSFSSIRGKKILVQRKAMEFSKRKTYSTQKL